MSTTDRDPWSQPGSDLLRALVDEIPGMIAYWDSDQRCRFANRAYERWYGVKPEWILGRHISELLGPLYPQNRRYIEGALRGEPQQFERELPDPSGGPIRHSLAHYVPDVRDGVVRGFFSMVTEVTAMKRVELQLRESEERFRLTFDEAPIGMALVAPDGRFERVNHALCSIVGYTVEELTGLTFQAITHPDDLDADLEVLARVTRGEIPRYQFEKRYLRKDGAVVCVMLSGSVLRGPDGKAIHFIAQIEDITPRKRLEAERRAREAERERLAAQAEARRLWLEAVLENVPLGVILFQPNGELSGNRRAEQLMGVPLSPTAGVAQYAGRILFPGGGAVPEEQLLSSRVLLTGETVIGAELVLQHPDGTRIPILGSAGPIRGADGKVMGAVAVFQDISERMRAEEAIRGSERLLSAIFEILPVGLWIADKTGHFIRENPSATELWGGHRSGIADTEHVKAWWVATGEPVARSEWPISRALAGERIIKEKMRIETFDGALKTIVNSALPLVDGAGRPMGAIVVHQDVSDLQRTEDSLRRAVRSRDEVLGVVAHDLRNPLNGILLQAQLLAHARSAGAEPVETKAAERIRRLATRMSRLIEDLLDVARIESGALSIKRAQVEVTPLLREVVDSQDAGATAAGVRLELDIRGRPANVLGDRERLLQVFENLIGNALKFTPEGGVIALGAIDRGSETVFWVADSGRGIAPELVPHLFNRFWQADRTDVRGAGLGLAIVKGIVEAHGGNVWVRSTPGAGTTFYFSAPAAQPDQQLHAPD